MLIFQVILLAIVGLFAIMSLFHLGLTILMPELRIKMMKQGMKDKIAEHLIQIFTEQDYPLPQRNALINQMSDGIDQLDIPNNGDDGLIGLSARVYFCDLLQWLSCFMLAMATTGQHILVVFVFIIGLLYTKKLVHEMIMEYAIDVTQPIVDKLPIQSADDIWQ